MTTDRNALSRGQVAVLGIAGAAMLATGIAGAAGTYTNIVAEFGRAATAAGMVAAGEGATLVLALVMVGVTLLGQAAPAPVRIGLWVTPLVASVVGLSIADDVTEAVIYAASPMGMCVSAEGLGFLARRIVVYRTGRDAEAQRRTAEAVQLLAFHRARAAGHPDEKVRRRSELKAWKLARRVGVGDIELGARLVAVQRERLCEGADAALAAMFGGTAPKPGLDAGGPAAGVTVDRADIGPGEPVTPPVPELEVCPLPQVTTGSTTQTTDMASELPPGRLQQATRRHATGLATGARPSPWQVEPQAPVPADVPAAERVPQAVPDVPGYTPEAYPEITTGVPETDPSGPAVPAEQPAQVPESAPRYPAAEEPRTRPEVRAEYVPDQPPEPVPDVPDVPEAGEPEDELTAQARRDFADYLSTGSLVPYRLLRERYGIGQARAQRIRDELKKGLPQ